MAVTARGETRRSPGRRARRLGARALAGVALILGVVVASTAAAGAHAELLGTQPGQGSVLRTAPSSVSLTFSEHVEISLGAIKVIDGNGHTVDTGTPRYFNGNGHEITASVPHLANGTYVVTWHVISADSHPVHGAFTFTIGPATAGATSSAQNLAAKLLRSGSASRTIGVLLGVTRWLIFGGLALLLGGACFAIAIATDERQARRAATIALIGCAITAVATIIEVCLQGPYGGALPLADALHWNVISSVLHTRLGHISIARLVMLAAALPLLILLRRREERPSRSWIGAGALLGLAIAATPGLAGHADTGEHTALAVPIDAVHVAAMCVWLGGLVVLVALAVRRADHPALGSTFRRFSATALWCVVAIVVSGVFASWRQVGFTFADYRNTTFGRLLLTKLAIFLVLIALAAVSRALVRRGARAASELEHEEAANIALGRSVGTEIVVAMAVLAFTAMLVNTQPARSELAQPFAKELRGTHLLVDVTMDPKRHGPNTLHVYTLTPSGAVAGVQEVTLKFSLPSKGISPISIRMIRVTPNHFEAQNAIIPFKGTWHLSIDILQDELDEPVFDTTVMVR